MLELQEILVTIDVREDTEPDCPRVSVEYVSLRHCFPSREMKAVPGQGHAMNHFLVPKIDDDGVVTGSYLMLNLRTYRLPPVQLKRFRPDQEPGYRQALREAEHEPQLRWQPKYYARAGSWAEVTSIQNRERLGLLFHDGRELTFGASALQEVPGRDLRDWRGHIQSRPYSFDYGVVELNDDGKPYDVHLQLETPLTQLGYKKVVFANRLGVYYTVTSARFLRKVIEQRIFDPNMQIMELYTAQKQNMVMARNNFLEPMR